MFPCLLFPFPFHCVVSALIASHSLNYIPSQSPYWCYTFLKLFCPFLPTDTSTPYLNHHGRCTHMHTHTHTLSHTHTHTQNTTACLSMLLFGFFFCILLVSDLSTALQMNVWALGNVKDSEGPQLLL